MKSDEKKTTKKSASSTKILVFILVAFLLKKVHKRIFVGEEPAACTSMRDFLLSSKKVSEWMLEKDPSKPGEFPEIPFHIVQQCGQRSFKMPFPYTFQFEKNPPSETYFINKFMEKNRTVSYREIPDDPIQGTFDLGVYSSIAAQKGSFENAWSCISKGKCNLCFDNSWKSEDYEGIMSKEAVALLAGDSFAGSMFLSNYPTKILSAAAHAAPFNSLATQMTRSKTWDFLSPEVVKKYFHLKFSKGVSLIGQMSQNHEDVLSKVPRFHVTTKAGHALFFPPFWHHIVTTEGGMNLMTNWRQPTDVIGAMRTSPHTWKNTMRVGITNIVTKYVLPFTPNIKDTLIIKGHDNFQKSLEKVQGFNINMYKLNAGKEL